MGKKKRKPKRRLPADERMFEGTKPKSKSKPAPDEAPPKLTTDVYEPLRVTMAHALAASTSGPLVVLTPLVMVALIWVGLLALGTQVFPPSMVQALALPPLSSIFDLGAAASLFGLSGTWIFGFFIGITLVRALFISLMAGMLDEALEYRSVSKLGILRGLNGFAGVLLYCYMGGAVGLIATQVLPQLLGSQIGATLVPVALVAGIFFLSFTPAAAVRLGVPAREALARSAKGARMGGWQRHLAMSALYYLITLFMEFGYPSGVSITANPSLIDWAYVLAAAFVNVVFLAAFIDRWRSIEDYVPRQIRSRSLAEKR
jgi:hypothetical protein